MSRLLSLRKLGAFLALIALGILVVGIQDLSLPTPHASLPEEYGEPDYYIEEAQLTRFNLQGERIQTLESTQVTHYPENDLALFEKPLMHYYSKQGQVWRVVAERAENQAEDDILLEENVVITPLNPDSTYLPEFYTNHLWVNTQTNIAHTKDPVSFLSPSGKTTGQGFQLDMDTGIAEILQEVQGIYLPSPVIQSTKP